MLLQAAEQQCHDQQWQPGQEQIPDKIAELPAVVSDGAEHKEADTHRGQAGQACHDSLAGAELPTTHTHMLSIAHLGQHQDEQRASVRMVRCFEGRTAGLCDLLRKAEPDTVPADSAAAGLITPVHPLEYVR